MMKRLEKHFKEINGLDNAVSTQPFLPKEQPFG